MSLYEIAGNAGGLRLTVRSDNRTTAARHLARLPAGATDPNARLLAGALTAISVTMAEECIRGPNRCDRALDALEGIDRAEQLEQLIDAVVRALSVPDPPDEDLQPLYEPSERAAHRAGRALVLIADPELSEIVTRQVEAELRGLVDATDTASTAAA